MKLVSLQVVLGIWFIATVLKQLNARWLSRIVRNDFGLVPSWTFFAPNPGRSDIRLVYRDRLPNGVSTQWQEACQKPLRNKWRFIWNPEKFKEKGVLDIALSLSRTVKSSDGKPAIAMLMWPYLVLLDRVLSEPRQTTGANRQFAILSTEGATAPRRMEALFLSGWHKFDA